MPKPVQRWVAAPLAWKGAHEELAFHRVMGARVLLDGDQLQIGGVELSAFSRWFDRSQPIWADKAGRLICHCGAGPVGLIWRVWQPGRESVAKVTYQQRARSDTGAEMVELRAVLHRASEYCAHGALVMHPGDSIEVHCRAHDLVLSGNQVVQAVLDVGGWDGGGHDPPTPRRVILR